MFHVASAKSSLLSYSERPFSHKFKISKNIFQKIFEKSSYFCVNFCVTKPGVIVGRVGVLHDENTKLEIEKKQIRQSDSRAQPRGEKIFSKKNLKFCFLIIKKKLYKCSNS